MDATAPLPATAQGKPITRVDGRLKVTGGARYAAEFAPPDAAHGYLVMSSISNGKVSSIDTADAAKVAGVLAVLTPANVPKFPKPSKPSRKSDGISIEERAPLADDLVHYGGQYIALVVAETFEQARYAASLLRISYQAETPAIRKEDAPQTAQRPEGNQGQKIQVTKGDLDKALQMPGVVKIEENYATPTETHTPMECSATVATWEAPDRLTIYDATQFVKGSQQIVADAFGLPRENVRVICPFVGGAFGCKGPVWSHTILAAIASKFVKRPVKLEVTRPQMFSGTGHRTPTNQKVMLAATPDGKLQAVQQQSESLTSPVSHWIEPCGIGAANVLYDAPAIAFNHTSYQVNIAPPSFMRAPGECPGTYAMECAMDELAYALKMDPVQLRLVNASPNHPIKEIPWSTYHVTECLKTGSEKFGWSRRNAEPGSMKDGNLLVGWGVALATYPANRWTADVQIDFAADGSAVVRCATHDLGTGAYTVMTQISADAIGVPVEKVTFDLGSSDLPFGPVAGGSNSTATVGSAIVAAAAVLHQKLAALAVADSESPLHGMNAGDLKMVAPGRLGADPAKSDGFTDILHRAGMPNLSAQGGVKGEKDESKGFQSFGAQFCEVKIDPDLPLVRVTRFVSVMDCGRVINPKTGGNQIVGGIVMGIGMALEEETVYDPATGLPVTRNLADYHVPVNADIHVIEPYFVGEPDFAFNPMGARGMGEIGNTGTAAAVANAVFHATRKRVRDLPITLDKLI